MRQSIEDSFNDFETFRRMKASLIYLYILTCVRRKKLWAEKDCKAIAYDLAMEAVIELLANTDNIESVSPDENYEFLMNLVKKYLRRKSYSSLVERRKNSKEKEMLHVADIEDLQTTVAESVDLATFMSSLTSDEKELYTLNRSGYKGVEIAEKMRISTATVSRMLDVVNTKLNRRK